MKNSKVDKAQCSSNALLLHPRGLSSISHGVDSFLIVDQCSGQQTEACKRSNSVPTNSFI